MKQRQRVTGGFTLIELLVVIGIIGVLISILIPVVGRMHVAAYETSTRSEIEQIGNACQNYYNDFRAYPGPVSNTDIENGMTVSPVAQPNISSLLVGSPIIISSTNTGANTGLCLNGASVASATPTMLFSGSENLVLGILGGLEFSVTASNPQGNIVFVNSQLALNGPTTLVGTGPRSLVSAAANPGSAKQYTSYMQLSFPGSTFLLNGDGTPQTVWNGVAPAAPVPAYHDAGGRAFLNGVVPVFTDQFPDAMPILYLRARVGAPGVISGPRDTSFLTPVTNPLTGGLTAVYNYDVREIAPFTAPSNKNSAGATFPGAGTGPGVPASGGIILATGVATGQHGLQAVGNGGSSSVKLPYYPVATTAPGNYPVPTNQVDNAGEYFLNATVAPTNATGAPTYDYINATGTPRNKDSFILISAGKDRTYGTTDDLTNFGDVQP